MEKIDKAERLRFYKDAFMYGLAAFNTLLWSALLYVVFIHPIPSVNHDVAVMLLGQESAIEYLIYAYFFGSSKGSADKTDSVNKAAEELAKNSTIKTTEQIETNIN